MRDFFVYRDFRLVVSFAQFSAIKKISVIKRVFQNMLNQGHGHFLFAFLANQAKNFALPFNKGERQKSALFALWANANFSSLRTAKSASKNFQLISKNLLICSPAHKLRPIFWRTSYCYLYYSPLPHRTRARATQRNSLIFFD